MGQKGVFWPTLMDVKKIGRHEFYYNFDIPRSKLSKEKKKKKKNLKNLKILEC